MNILKYNFKDILLLDFMHKIKNILFFLFKTNLKLIIKYKRYFYKF